jgi:hypothetical protein
MSTTVEYGYGMLRKRPFFSNYPDFTHIVKFKAVEISPEGIIGE